MRKGASVGVGLAIRVGAGEGKVPATTGVSVALAFMAAQPANIAAAVIATQAVPRPAPREKSDLARRSQTAIGRSPQVRTFRAETRPANGRFMESLRPTSAIRWGAGSRLASR